MDNLIAIITDEIVVNSSLNQCYNADVVCICVTLYRGDKCVVVGKRLAQFKENAHDYPE